MTATASTPVRIACTINQREYEIVAGELELDAARAADPHEGVTYIGRSLRDLFAELVAEMTSMYGTGETMTSEQPTIGGIVHYRHYGTPGGEFPPKDSPAIVTGIVDEQAGIVSLTVFTSDGGIHPHKAVRHDEQLAGGTWHWPPRAPLAGPGSPRSAYEASHPNGPGPQA